jgi:hypothetical protein
MSSVSHDRNRLWLKGLLIPAVGAVASFVVLYWYNTRGAAFISEPEYKIIEQIILAVLSSFIVSAILDVVLKQDFMGVIRLQMLEAIKEAFSELSNIKRHGLKDLNVGLPYERYVEVLANAREARILQTFIPDMPSILSELRAMLQHGGKVEILILDPRSPAAQIRADSLKRTLSYVTDGIYRCFEDLDSLIEDPKSTGTIEVKLYTELPSISLYQADEALFIGHYLIDLHAVEGPQLELELGKYYSEIVLDHFRLLWESAKPYTREDFKVKDEKTHLRDQTR